MKGITGFALNNSRTVIMMTVLIVVGGWQIREGEEILSEANTNEMMERTGWGGLLEPEDVKAPIEDKEGGN